MNGLGDVIDLERIVQRLHVQLADCDRDVNALRVIVTVRESPSSLLTDAAQRGLMGYESSEVDGEVVLMLN